MSGIAYNEEGCIESTCLEWLKAARQHGDRVIVVNDGSKDKTGEVLDRLAAQQPNLQVVRQKNAGHGAAVIKAYLTTLTSDVKWVFQVDSDDQFVPAEFSRLWEHRHSHEFVLGVRSPRSDGWHRILLSRILAKLIFLRYGVALADANVPFRLIRADILRRIVTFEVIHKTIVPNIFLPLIAKSKLGCSIRQVAFTHKPRQTGEDSLLGTKIVKFGIRVLGDLLPSPKLSKEVPGRTRANTNT